jgi:hypothetical protein
MEDRVQGKLSELRKRQAELRKRQSEIAFELKQVETIEAKRQRCSNDVEEAICLLKSEFMDLKEVLEHSPDIGLKREFWEAFLCSKNEIPRCKGFPDLLSKYANLLLEDRDLVLKLCAYNAPVYFNLSQDLKQDEGILEVLLTSSPSNVLEIDDNVQQMYPALVASAVERLDLSTPESRIYALQFINASLWAHRNVALAWASAGGPFLSGFPEEFNDDEELLVAFLRNDGGQLKPTPRLLADKQFMLKAVKARPACYLTKVSKELVGDWDLLLTAMADPRIAFLNGYCLTKGGWISYHEGSAFDFWVDASKAVRGKLHAHDIFVKLMLGGMMATPGGSTPLTLLNQGKETSLAFTKPIAEYLGVPMGEELCMLRKARKNLALVGVHWENSC